MLYNVWPGCENYLDCAHDRMYSEPIGRRYAVNKQNCWEYMECGKEPGGVRADESGVCPVAAAASVNGLNGGINGGRLCWVMAETCGHVNVKCSPLHQPSFCYSCEFRYRVTAEEGLLNVCNATGRLLQLISEPAE